MFCGGLIESSGNKIEVLIEDIQPDAFQVLLRWLYGQEDVIPKPDNFRMGQEYYTADYLTFLIDILRVTDIYDVKSLKNEVKDIIIKGQYTSVHNLYKILKCSEEYNVQQLRKYYENHIKLNSGFIREELHRNTVNNEERSEILSLLPENE